MRFIPGQINIICTNADRSLKFYQDVLGFEVVEKEEPAVHLRCAETSFLLLPVAAAPGQRADYCSVPEFSIDMMVDDIAEAHSHCTACGVTIVTEWTPDQQRFFIRDPDGLVLEIIESPGR